MSEENIKQMEFAQKERDAETDQKIKDGTLVEPLSSEEEKQLRYEKLREEADSRDADLAEGWTPNE